MSYNTIAAMANDEDLKLRLVACAALEGVRAPVDFINTYVWEIVGNQEMVDVYAYAVGVGTVERPGRDEGVINDDMILAHVQPLVLRTNPNP